MNPDEPICGNLMQDFATARRGDSEALGRVLTQVRKYLHLIVDRAAQANVQSKLDPEDLVQEALFKALRTLSEFHGTTLEELHGWLRSIMTNLQHDSERRWHAQRRDSGREVSIDRLELAKADPSDARATSPLQHLIHEERVARVQAALDQLRPTHREALRLRWRENATLIEVGRRLGRSTEAARKLCDRALAELRSLLENQEDSDFSSTPPSVPANEEPTRLFRRRKEVLGRWKLAAVRAALARVVDQEIGTRMALNQSGIRVGTLFS